ncbi:hypothetical protein [Clostridium ganghwense]|uniref:Uncharacterized protein n=1 Tax=Clostridium ganghwense TaxID=312089 RepID=A0ABT4CRT7_9CLOT|nr:hypothetical protein [Clostridium ganghwense]MCY6371779.1 hypothetical protein [Clostridium ganghwense]
MKFKQENMEELMQNVSKNLDNICSDNRIIRVTLIEILVDFNSHINEENFLQYLIEKNRGFVDKYTKVKIRFKDMPKDTAIISEVDGDKM